MSIFSELFDHGANKSESYCATVLGSSGRVKQIASFHRDENNKKSIQLIMTKGLLDFTEGELFTPEEHAAYRKGLGVVLEFMVKAEKEVDEKTEES